MNYQNFNIIPNWEIEISPLFNTSIELDNNKYIIFNEENNAIDYLEKASYFIQEAKHDPYYYKWVIISLFNALYGFAVCAARGTNNELISNTNKKGWNYLKTFDEIIELCQNKEYMNMTIYSKPLTLSSNQIDSIRVLKNELRNSFEHFTPKTWIIEIRLITQIIPDIVDIISFLALNSGNYVLLNEIKKNYVKELLERTKASSLG